jgi:hypothetical protein
MDKLKAKDSVSEADLKAARTHLYEQLAEIPKSKPTPVQIKQAATLNAVIDILSSPLGPHTPYSFLFKDGAIPADVFAAWAGMHLVCLRSTNSSCEALRVPESKMPK